MCSRWLFSKFVSFPRLGWGRLPLCDQLIPPRGGCSWLSGGSTIKTQSLESFLQKQTTEMCQKMRGSKINPTRPAVDASLIVLPFPRWILLHFSHDCRYFQDSFCLGNLSVTNSRSVYFDCFHKRMSVLCLRPTQHNNQTSNYCQNGLSLLTPPAPAPTPRCEKDEHVLQNIPHQWRRHFRVYLGDFNAAERSRTFVRIVQKRRKWD